MKIDVEKIEEEMRKVPFGNSHFQNAFFTDGQETPERRARHILLQLNKKIQALKACEFRRERLEIDLEEIEERIIEASGGMFRRKDERRLRRLEIDKKEKEWGLKSELKLIEDAVIEVETYAKMLERLPKLKDRAQFEAAELRYWQARLKADAARELIAGKRVEAGTQKALSQVGIDTKIDRKTGELVFLNRKVGAINDFLRECEAVADRKTDRIAEDLPTE